MLKHKSFGEKLKRLRRDAKLKIERVAADTGISVRALRTYEQGANAPKDDAKIILCDYYGVSVADIFFS